MAHQGVRNPAVKARMDLMAVMAASTKTLGRMAKGEKNFDPALANAALSRLGAAAAETPRLFEAPETDPASEALPEIWLDFDDFTRRSRTLEKVVRAAAPIETPNDLRAALRNLGKTCSSCHKVYRMP